MNYGANSTAIIIPCFNAERTLAATIESALREDVAEIVVIDDGSTDG